MKQKQNQQKDMNIIESNLNKSSMTTKKDLVSKSSSKKTQSSNLGDQKKKVTKVVDVSSESETSSSEEGITNINLILFLAGLLFLPLEILIKLFSLYDYLNCLVQEYIIISESLTFGSIKKLN